VEPLTLAALVVGLIGQGAAEEVGRAATAKVGKLLRLVADRLQGNPTAETALAAVQTAPENSEAARQLATTLEAEIIADSAFAQSLDVAAQEARNDHSINQQALIAVAGDVHKQVIFQRDVHVHGDLNI
jgi:hypothetical protein